MLDADDVVLMSGDHVVVTKSGKMTYGLERFFVPVWDDGARPVFSEFIPAECHKARQNRLCWLSQTVEFPRA